MNAAALEATDELLVQPHRVHWASKNVNHDSERATRSWGVCRLAADELNAPAAQIIASSKAASIAVTHVAVQLVLRPRLAGSVQHVRLRPR